MWNLKISSRPWWSYSWHCFRSSIRFGDAPIFLALTQRYPRSAQRILARKIAAYGFALLAGSFLFGSIILDFFGISIVVIQIAGGLVVAATGWALLNQQDSAPQAEEATETLEDGTRLLPADFADHGRPGMHLHRDHAGGAHPTPGGTRL
ncbi:MAG TPA: MarC family protein [Candidatus Methylomirabilis sp.]|nr:MarC family protein [Candidatus Methylomirabilis sp.]